MRWPGCNHGHDLHWKSIALEIGCDGNRCYGEEVSRPEPKYTAICPKCQHEYHRHKAPKFLTKQSCGKCGTGKFDESLRLWWKLNVSKHLEVSKLIHTFVA